MRPSDRPGLATTHAGWLRQINRAASLLIVIVLLALLFRAGREALAEGERMALGLAEQHLQNLVWLEAKRVIAEEGITGLQRRVGQDPRVWARGGIAVELPETVRQAGLPGWAEERWSFDAIRGELHYQATWIEDGDARWRVELVKDGLDSPSPGLARDLRLVRLPAPAAAH